MENNNSVDYLAKYVKDTEKIGEQYLNRNKVYRMILVKKGFLRSLIGLDYALPFIVAASIIYGKVYYGKNAPFVIDDVVERASVEVMDNSLGMHTEKKSYDYNYKDISFEHSTGWRCDENGLYERVVTIYRTLGVDFSNPDDIFSLTNEEIKERFIVTNVKTIKKSILDLEDEYYNEDCFTIVQHMDSIDDYIVRKETMVENFFNTLAYLANTAIVGLGLTKVKKLLFKTKVKDKLKEKEKEFVFLDNGDLKEFEKIYKLRNENISLLQDSSDVADYQLRKKR